MLGRHPCTGSKVAKLEMKVVIAALLLTFDYKLVDANGSPVHEVPATNKNDYQQVKLLRALDIDDYLLTSIPYLVSPSSPRSTVLAIYP